MCMIGWLFRNCTACCRIPEGGLHLLQLCDDARMHCLWMWDEGQARELPAIEENGTVIEEMWEQTAPVDFQRTYFPERNVDDVLSEPETSFGAEETFVCQEDTRRAAAEESIEGGVVEQEQEDVSGDERDDRSRVIPRHECAAESRAKSEKCPRGDNQEYGHAILHPVFLDEEQSHLADIGILRRHCGGRKAAECMRW